MDDKLNKYQRLNAVLPAEATGAFVAIQAALNQIQPNLPIFTAVVTLSVVAIIAIFLPFYLKNRLLVGDTGQRRLLVATFVIWSLSIIGEVHYINLFQAAGVLGLEEYFMPLLRIFVILWTFFFLPFASRPPDKAAEPDPLAQVED